MREELQHVNGLRFKSLQIGGLNAVIRKSGLISKLQRKYELLNDSAVVSAVINSRKIFLRCLDMQ